MKLSRNKEKDGGNDDPNRSGLFGRRKAPAANDNPYAQGGGGDDPYANATPYQQARSGLPSGPRMSGGPGGPSPGPGGRMGLPSGPGGPRGSVSSVASAPPPYSAQQQPQPGGGYGNQRVGNTGGYGGNRYDDGASGYGGSRQNSSASMGSGPAPRAGARGAGGYGGMGGGDLDANKDALFGGAKDRYVPPSRKFDQGYGGQSGSSGAGGDAYDGYGQQRELSEEEQAAQDLRDTSNQIRQVRDESLASGLRSLQMIEQSEETARGTLARLGAQHDRLHNTEMNLDRAAIHNRTAEEKTKELKTLNRSMFAVHVGNPFTSKQRAAQREQEVLDKHRQDRETREATRKDGFASTQRMEDTFRGAERAAWRSSGDSDDEGEFAKAASKFTFVDDDDEDGEQAAEDLRKERQIRDNEKAMLQGVKKLNYLARAIGDEVDSQNKLIDRITVKSDAVDDGVRMNREKLNRF